MFVFFRRKTKSAGRCRQQTIEKVGASVKFWAWLRRWLLEEAELGENPVGHDLAGRPIQFFSRHPPALVKKPPPRAPRISQIFSNLFLRKKCILGRLKWKLMKLSDSKAQSIWGDLCASWAQAEEIRNPGVLWTKIRDLERVVLAMENDMNKWLKWCY